MRAQHEQDQADSEKQMLTLRGTIKQGEVTIENMNKYNDFQMKELVTEGELGAEREGTKQNDH